VAWKKKLKSRTPFIFFQFLVVKPNEHQTGEIKRLAKEYGVDEVRFKTAQIYDFENDPNQLIPLTSKYSRYKKDKRGVYRLKNSLSNHCWRLWHATVITWDGMVVPCCFDKDARHKLGDLKGKSFSEIWKNDNYVQFRKQVLRGRANIDICANCSEGTKVWSE
jgi:radical SAM protein with 4Fe4S-binding SPASM domain